MQFVADFPFYFYFYSSQPSEVGLGKIQETTNRYIIKSSLTVDCQCECVHIGEYMYRW